MFHRSLKRCAVVLLLALAGCASGSRSTTGGITISATDTTPPTLSFGAGQPGGQNVSVSAGGSPGSMTLRSKTGVLNLMASANDPESGVQSLQIWMTTETTTCNASGICTKVGPGLAGAPKYDNTSPQKLPGQTTAASSIMLEALDLSQEIGSPPAGSSRTTSLHFWAVSVNNLGLKSQTPELIASWREP